MSERDADDHAPPWPPPWRSLDEQQRRRFTAELRAEVAPGHSLYDVPADAVAICQACDNVIFVAEKRWFVVHLTWNHPDRPPWPHIVFESTGRLDLLRMTAEDGHDEEHSGEPE